VVARRVLSSLGRVSGGRSGRREAAILVAVRAGDDIGGSLGKHVDIGGDEEPGYQRKNRGVDDAKPADATHAETAVQYRHGIAARSDRTTAPPRVAHG